jgi:hypothetical protein
LDPSEFSIRTARQKLRSPFLPSNEFCCTAQQFRAPEEQYKLVWATHALYCVPTQELGLALANMWQSCDASGLGFVAQASRNSHYLQFHDLYVDTVCPHLEKFCSGEQLLEVLQRTIGSDAVTWTIDYEGRLPLEERETAELYLQRCLFDETLSLDEMLAHAELGSYLDGCIDRNNGLWRFPQQVCLAFFGGAATEII